MNLPKSKQSSTGKGYIERLIYNLPAATVVHSPDTKIKYCNKTALNILGLTDRQAMGKDAFDPAWHFINDKMEALPLEEYPVNKVMATLKPLKSKLMGVIRSAGEQPVWVMVDAMPVFNSNQEVEEIIVSFLDVTEHQNSDEKIKELAHINTLIAEESPDGIAVYEEDGQCLFANEKLAEIIGATRADLEKQNFHHIESWKKSGLLQLAIETLNTSTTHAKELSLVTTFKKKVTLEFILNSIETKNGKKLLLIAHDIGKYRKVEEDLKRAKRLAEEANQAKSDFLTTISHEIRTPMNIIMGMTELLLESEKNNGKKERLRTDLNAGKGLLALINDILDISKIETGEFELNLSSFNVRTLIKDNLSIFKSVCDSKGIKLICEIDPEVPDLLRGDQMRVGQVLINLIGNACKFTSKGFVKVSLHVKDKNNYLFIIQDTGVGISEQKLKDIFKPFVQEDAGITREFGGTGLGLTICQRILNKMNSVIQVESQKGIGTKFSFTLNLETVKKEKQLNQQYLKNKTKLHPLKILIAEDSKLIAELVKALLAQSPHNLVFATNGEEALSLFKEHGDFDLVLMDVQMPKMDGYSATTKIRAWEKANGREPTQIHALSAHAFTSAQEQSIAAGCDGHLTKPINKQQLLEFLDHISYKISA